MKTVKWLLMLAVVFGIGVVATLFYFDKKVHHRLNQLYIKLNQANLRKDY
jgi:hypothetical protein